MSSSMVHSNRVPLCYNKSKLQEQSSLQRIMMNPLLKAQYFYLADCAQEVYATILKLRWESLLVLPLFGVCSNGDIWYYKKLRPVQHGVKGSSGEKTFC